jgi:FMN phosphatase YigB (HAD superfamily)
MSMSNATSAKFFEGVKAVFSTPETLFFRPRRRRRKLRRNRPKIRCRASAADIRARFEALAASTSKKKGISFLNDRDGTKKFWETFVAEVFQPYMAELTDFKAFFDELYEKFASEKAWRLFDDRVPTLDYLKRKGYRLAVVSNRDYRCRGLSSPRPVRLL